MSNETSKATEWVVSEGTNDYSVICRGMVILTTKNRLCAKGVADAHNTALQEQAVELQAWRYGGLTEEILRRQNGCIKVGRGCAIVLSEERAEQAATIERLKNQLRDSAIASMEQVDRLVAQGVDYEKIIASLRAQLAEKEEAI